MNKKLGIVLVFALLVGAVFLSACQQDAVGRKLIKSESKKVYINNGDVDEGDGRYTTAGKEKEYPCPEDTKANCRRAHQNNPEQCDNLMCSDTPY